MRLRYRALADPSRAGILAELAGGGLLDTRELAERVGLHPNTVRVHLGVLADAGMVEAETLPARGRGRPRLAYRAVGESPDQAGGRRYRLLAEILTELVARFGGEAAERLEQIGESWGRELAGAPPSRPLSDAEAVERLLALLDGVGFEPRLTAGRRPRILMRPCPFLELARRHQEVVCPIHLGMIRGALAELGATTRASSLEPFVRDDLCVAHLARGGR